MNRIVAPLIAQHTEQWVEGINAKDLRIGVLGGDIELKNLKVKKSALAEMNLPMDVVRGSLSKLAIKVPWTNLSGKAVEVEIDQLLLLAKPKSFGRKSLFVRFQPHRARRKGGKVQLAGLEFHGDTAGNPVKIVAIHTVTANDITTDVSKTFLDPATGQWRDCATYIGSPSTAVVVQLENPAIVRGYRIRTCADSVDTDPVEWEVEGAARLKGPFKDIHVFNEDEEKQKKRKAYDPPAVEVPRARQAWTGVHRDLIFAEEDPPTQKVVTAKREAADQHAAALDVVGDDEVDPGFVERLQETIVANIRVRINTIHIRYEDDVTCPANPHVSGVYLRDLELYSTDASFKKSFMTTVGDLVHKAAKLEDFGVYMNHAEAVTMTAEMADSAWHHFMVDSINESRSQHTHILSPLSLELGLQMKTVKGKRKAALRERPNIDAAVTLQDLALEMNRPQVVSLFQALKFVESYAILDKHARYRPNYPVKGHARLWWIFMKRSLVRTLREQKEPTDASKRGKKRILADYVQAYMGTQAYPWAPAVDKTSRVYKLRKRALDAYDYHLPQEELNLFRTAIHGKEKAERELWEKKEKAKADKLAKAKANQSWGGWLMGAAVEVSDDEEEAEEAPVDAKQQLMDSIGYAVDADAGQESPRQESKFHSATVFTMRVDRTRLILSEAKDVRFGEVELSGFRLGLDMMVGASATEMKIKDFAVRDVTQDRGIVTVREAGSEHVFEMRYDTPPRDEKADSSLYLRGRGLDFWFDPAWLSRVMWLVQIPQDVNLGAIEAAAKAAAAEIGSSATRGLLEAMETQQSIALEISIEGPKVHVPYTPTAALEVNLGTLTLEAAADKGRKERVRLGTATEEDYYDTLHINLEGVLTTLLRCDAGTGIAAAIKARAADRAYVLNDVGFNFAFANCLVPDDPERASAKLDGEFTPIGMRISPTSATELLMGLNVVTAWAANPTGTELLGSDGWRGAVKAQEPKYVLQGGRGRKMSRIATPSLTPKKSFKDAPKTAETWVDFTATFLPNNKTLLLDRGDGHSVSLAIGAQTVVETMVGFACGGDVTLTLRLPQEASKKGSYVEVVLKIKHADASDPCSAAALSRKLRETVWKAQEWERAVQTGRMHTNARAARAAEADAALASPRSPTEVQGPPPTKVTFLCALRLPKLYLNLLDGNQRSVLGMNITGLAVDFEQRPRDMAVTLALGGCSIDDSLLEDAQGKAPVLVGFETAECGKKGIQISYVSAMDGSPYPWRHEENTGIRVDFKCDLLRLDSERTTLPKHLGYALEYTDVMPKDSTVAYYETRAPREAASWLAAEGAEAEKQPATKVLMDMAGFEGVFRNDRKKLYSIMTSVLHMEVNVVPEDAMTVGIQCGDFNLRHHAADNEHYQQLVSTRPSAGSLLEVEYKQLYNPVGEKDVPQYTSFCKVRFGQCSVVYLQRTIGQLQRFFDVGYIMRDMSAATEKSLRAAAYDTSAQAAAAVQEAAAQAALERGSSFQLMHFDIAIDKPTLVVPFAYDSTGYAELVLGDLGFVTELASKPVAGGRAHYEVMHITLNDTAMRIAAPAGGAAAGMRDRAVVHDWSIRCEAERVVADPSQTLPGMKLDSTVGDMQATLSKAQYEALMVILNSNVFDAWVDDSLEIVAAAAEEAAAEQQQHVDPTADDALVDLALPQAIEVTPEGPPVSVDFSMVFHELSVALETDTEPLMLSYLRGMALSHVMEAKGRQETKLAVEAIGVSDVRPDASPLAKDLFVFGVGAMDAADSPPASPSQRGDAPLFARVADGKGVDTMDVNLPAAAVTVIPGLLGAAMNFFVSQESAIHTRQERAAIEDRLRGAKEKGDTVLAADTADLTLTEDLFLGPENMLLALTAGQYSIDGQNKYNVYLTGDCACTLVPRRTPDKLHYAVVLGDGAHVTLRNTAVYSQAALEDYVLPGSDAGRGVLVLDPQTCKHVTPQRKAKGKPPAATTGDWKSTIHVQMPRGFSVHLPEDCFDFQSQKLVMLVEGDLRMESGPGASKLTFESRKLTIFPTHMKGGYDRHESTCNNLLGPAGVKFVMASVEAAGDRAAHQELELEGKNMNLRVSYHDIKLALKVNEHLMAAMYPVEEEKEAAVVHDVELAPDAHLHLYAPLLTHAGQAQQGAASDEAAPPSRGVVHVALDSFSLLILDDQQGYERDLLRFSLRVPAKQATGTQNDCVLAFWFQSYTEDGATTFNGETDVRYALDHYNHSFGVWEPIMEEHESNIVMKQVATGFVYPAQQMHLFLSGRMPFHVNLSQDTLGALLQVSADWQKGLFEKEEVATMTTKVVTKSGHGRGIKARYRYTLTNQTGLTLEVSGLFKHSTIPADADGVVKLADVPLKFNVADDAGAEGGVDLNFHFGAAGMRAVRLTESEGVQHVVAPRQLLQQDERRLLVRTRTHNGRCFLTVTSPCVVENHSSLPLDVLVQGATLTALSKPEDPQSCDSYRVGVPLWALGDPVLGISMKPSGGDHGDYAWSTVSGRPTLLLQDQKTQPRGTLMCGYKGTVAGHDQKMCFVYNLATVSKDRVGHYQVVEVKAPLLLENLLPVMVQVEVLGAPRGDAVLFTALLDVGETKEFFGTLPDDELFVVYHVLTKDGGMHNGQDFEQSKPIHVQTASSDKRAAALKQPLAEHSVSIEDKAAKRRVNFRILNAYRGERAHREVSILCHYWIVNLSSHNLFVRDEKNRVITYGLLKSDAETEAARQRAPVLFSGLDDADPFEGKIGFGVMGHDRSCSAKFSQDVVGLDGEAACVCGDAEERFGVSISVAPGKNVRSKVVTVTDRWRFRNLSGTDLVVKRTLGMRLEKTPLASGASANVHFAASKGTQDEILMLSIADEEGWTTETPVRFTNLGTQHIKLCHESKRARVIDMKVVQVRSVNYVVFHKTGAPPWKVINNTAAPVQIGGGANVHRAAFSVAAFSHANYYPVQPDNKEKKELTVRVGYEGWEGDVALVMGAEIVVAEKNVCLRVELGYESMTLVLESLSRQSLVGVWLGNGSAFRIGLGERRADGSVMIDVECLQASCQETAMRMRAQGVMTGDSFVVPPTNAWVPNHRAVYCARERKLHWYKPDAPDAPYQSWTKRADFEVAPMPHTLVSLTTEFGVSMIMGDGDARRELAHLSLGGVRLEYKQKRETLDLKVCVGSIQLDDQQVGATFPVIFTTNVDKGRMELAKNKKKKQKELNALELNVVDYSTRIGGMTTAFDVGFLLLECELHVTDKILFELAEFFGTLMGPGRGVGSRAQLYEYLYTEEVYDEKVHGAGGAADQLYIHHLILNPMKFVITFEASDIGGQLGTLFSSVTMSFTNIEDGVLKLAALEMNRCNGLYSDLMDVVVKHYTSSVMKGAYALIGALDFIGNPVGLFTNFGDGVSDLFYEPYHGATESPEAFAVGLGRGAASLGRHAVVGVMGTVSGVTSSISDGLAGLSMDKEYVRNRRKRKKVEGLGDGAVQGVTAFGKGIFDGLSGIVLKPIEGAKKEGGVDDKMLAVGKGVGKGIIGAPVKIVGGVFDMVSKTMEGVKTTVSGVEELKRVRPPQTLVGGVIRPYNLYKARAAWHMMQKLDMQGEVIALLVPFGVMFTVFTNCNVIVFESDGQNVTTRKVVHFGKVRHVNIASAHLVELKTDKEELAVHINAGAEAARMMQGVVDLCSRVIPSVPMTNFAFGSMKGGEVEVWEKERKTDEGYSKALLRDDGPVWADAGMMEERQKAVFRTPPAGTVWMTNWKVATTEGTDAAGWLYAAQFDAVTSWHAGGSKQPDDVRRRRWLRQYAQFTYKDAHAPKEGPPAASSSDNAPGLLQRHTEAGPATAAAAEERRSMVETYENQRYYPIVGWSSKLLPTDGPKWSCKNRKEDRRREVLDQRLGKEWRWLGTWEMERSSDTDKDGWTYAVDFPFKYHNKKSAGHCVRRRRWFRQAFVPAPEGQ
eukprot:TRINITY_DN6997_c0_g3_i1.p1 TRINITY_DN6997_c0_g3~~TRINITY_DN6997_c0_g3_i1.p1  ORF type:complete len:3924 (+),score=1494.40 TRINITY_DN6997_c0_g3_i1:108-11879(+)